MERSLNEYDLLKVFCVLLVIIGHVLNMYDAKGMVCIAEVPSFNIAKDCIYSFHMPVFCCYFWCNLCNTKEQSEI